MSARCGETSGAGTFEDCCGTAVWPWTRSTGRITITVQPTMKNLLFKGRLASRNSANAQPQSPFQREELSDSPVRPSVSMLQEEGRNQQSFHSGSSACFGSGSQKLAIKPTRYTERPTPAATSATFVGA